MNSPNEKRLLGALGVTVLILLMEVIGGFLSNSLALLSDAGHNLTDAFALGLSLIAAIISKKPADHRATYGYQRFGLMAAVINGFSLLVIAIFVFYESYKRFVSPPQINTPLMITIATIGLIGNLVAALIIGRGHVDLNIKSAWVHLLGDTMSSIGVIVSGIVIYFTGWLYADPISSVIIGIGIIAGGTAVVKEATYIFLELTPEGFDVEEIARKIAEMPEVMGIHDVHIWSIAHRTPACSAHIWIPDQRISEADAIRKKVEDKLMSMGIKHTVLQLECAECEKNGLFCQIHLEEKHQH